MTDHGTSNVLGAATLLPATSGALLFLSSHTDPFVVAGLLGVSVVSTIVLIGSISRYIINSRRLKRYE